MIAPVVLLLAPVVLIQDGTELSPTPPPDHFDAEHDSMLYEAWKWRTPFDSHLPPQAPPIRPRSWRVLSPPHPSEFLREHVVARSASSAFAEAESDATMPEAGELRGDFTFAFTVLEMDRDEVRFVRAPGAETIFVNGDGFVGDPDRRGWLGVPACLRRGSNELLVTGIRGGFELELWDPVTRIVMGSWAIEVTRARDTSPWPDAWDHLHVPLLNASTSLAEWIHVPWGFSGTRASLPQLRENGGAKFTYPLAMQRGTTYAFSVGDGVPDGDEFLAPVAAYVPSDPHADRRLIGLRRDSPRPTWPAPVAPAWPPNARLATLIVERTPDEHLNDELVAVARYCQQRLWERSGILAPLLPEKFFLENPLWHDERGSNIGESQILRLGLLAGADQGVLRAGSEEIGESRTSYYIRASSADALRLVYAVDPLLGGVRDGAETWHLP